MLDYLGGGRKGRFISSNTAGDRAGGVCGATGDATDKGMHQASTPGRQAETGLH